MWVWTEEVTKRLKGNLPGEPEAGDWPNAEDYKKTGGKKSKTNYIRQPKN